MTRSIFSDVAEIVDLLQLPPGFYERLLEEDDWSFVIKLSSLFEGACTHVLTKRLNKPELNQAFAHLDMANSKFGKIVMLKILGAITPEQFNILKELAELRNKLVHNIANVTFQLQTYFNSLDASQVKSKVKLFGHGLQDELTFGNRTVTRAQFVCENPKVSIWLTAAEVLACLCLDLEVAQLELERDALDRYIKLAH